MKTTAAALIDLQQKLRSLDKTKFDRRAFVGFDGFVDKIKKAVKETQPTGNVYFDLIQEFAMRIAAAAGRSGQIQMDVLRIKMGGNAPILANALANLGAKSFCMGSVGFPVVHEVFAEMNPAVQLIPSLSPGASDAIEFSDGKVIFSELEVFEHYDWNYIKDTIGLERIRKAISESALLAFVDWANLPHASAIWKGVYEDIIKPSGRKDFLFLFDLCDPSKKTAGEVTDVLDLMSDFSTHGRVVLGLNENETRILWSSLNGVDFRNPAMKDKIPSVRTAGEFVYQRMNIDSLLVHPIDRCLFYGSNEIIELEGRFVTQPKVQTGGGDNLNAGFIFGLLAGLSDQECMLLGMATSGAYIENGASPSLSDIEHYLDVWVREWSLGKVVAHEPEFSPHHEKQSI